MPTVGVRELKARASEILREVREKRVRYVVTHHGKPVSLLLPIDDALEADGEDRKELDPKIWDELSRLGEEIGRGWQSPLSSAELLSEMRR